MTEEEAVESSNELTEEQQEAQEAVDFEAGFTGDKSPDPTEPVATDPAPGAESDGTDEAPDPVEPIAAEAASNTEAVSADQTDAPNELAELRKTVQAQANRIRTMEGHYGNLNGSVQELRNTAAEATHSVEIPTKEQVTEAVQSGEKFSALKADFPDWGEGMDEALQTVIQSQPDPVDTEQLMVDIGQQTKAFVTSELAKGQVEIKHPGWGDLVASEEFITWQNSQPAEVQQLAMSSEAKDAIRLLDLYQGQTTASTTNSSANADENNRPANNERLAGAVDPDTTSSIPNRGTSDEEDFLSSFKTG